MNIIKRLVITHFSGSSVNLCLDKSSSFLPPTTGDLPL